MKKLFLLFTLAFVAMSCEMIDEKLDDFLGRDDSSVTTIANNQIWYTSTDGEIVEPYSGVYNNNADALTTFGVNIVSNTYVDGKGVIEFDGDVTTIGDLAFYNCSSLTSVTIPDSVTTIGEGAFYWCYSLTSITIGDSVTTIGERVFYNCSSLQEFNGKFASEDSRCLIVDSTLNSFARAGLTEYNIPDSVTTIGGYAFGSCDSLTSVTIPDSVTTIGSCAFESCSRLTSVTIGDSVTMIGDYAFVVCSSLTSVTIPDSVTTIGYRAFYNCRNLTSVTIGNSVTTIGNESFYNCSSLTSVTIPDSVTTIRDWAFRDCTSLTSVYCKPTTPPVAIIYYDYWDAFDYNASGRKIYVPMESVEAYKSASGWSEYKSSIVGYNF